MYFFKNIIFVLCFFYISSCSSKFVRVNNLDLEQKYFAKINKINKKLSQIKAELFIKISGLFGPVISEHADLLVQKPNLLYWSLRSFLGSPVFIIASNGREITKYDFSGESQETYVRKQISNKSSFELFDFAFDPNILAQLFLLKIPLDKITNTNFYTSNNLIKFIGELPANWLIESHINSKLDQIIFTSMNNFTHNIGYKIWYKNFREIDGTVFPTLLVIEAQGKTRNIRLRVNLSKIKLNGKPLGEETFFLSRNF